MFTLLGFTYHPGDEFAAIIAGLLVALAYATPRATRRWRVAINALVMALITFAVIFYSTVHWS